MTEPDDSPPGGVLAGLPSARPQRRSPKRAGRPAGDAAPAPTPPRPPAKPRARAPEPKPPAGVRTEAAATQGFEADNARGAVEPPSRADLLGSVAEGAGELAHVGLALSRHVLRSVIGRLRGG